MTLLNQRDMLKTLISTALGHLSLCPKQARVLRACFGERGGVSPPVCFRDHRGA